MSVNGEKQKTRVIAVSVMPLSERALFEKCARLIGNARLSKAMRTQNEKERLLSVGASLLIRHAFSLFGKEFSEDSIVYGKNGKPLVADNSFSFNVSHSESLAVIAVSDCPVGCDAEFIRPAPEGVAKRFFSEDEYAYYLSAKDRDRAFFRVWTAKESFIKFSGDGLSRPLPSFSVISADGGLPSTEKCNFTFFDSVPGYAVSLCSDPRAPVAGFSLTNIEMIIQ